MALLRQKLRDASQNRPPHNKEPEWSSLCNNVFDEFLDPSDELFDLGSADLRGRAPSEDSSNLFDFSASSEQSSNTTANTAGTSPIHANGVHTPHKDMATMVPATQPSAKEPVGFWRRTLRALERTAAKTEDKQKQQHQIQQRQQHQLRSSKSHPDFLSLGGHPSPPALPPSPTIQSLSVQRTRAHASANGSDAPGTPHRSQTPGTHRPRVISSATRSVSRGRPTGVSKHHPAASHPSNSYSSHAAGHPYATVKGRNVSSSPHKMMNPSRYRAGFKDVWYDRLEASAKKYDLRVPSHALPVSPPPSGRCMQDDFAGFGTPPAMNPLVAYDEQLSPLTTTFQHANIHTPMHSPLSSPRHSVHQSYFEALPPSNQGAQWAEDTAPLDGGVPVYADRSASLVANKIQHFDFGFSSSSDEFEGWNASFGEPTASTQWGSFASSVDPFVATSTHHGLPTCTATSFDTGAAVTCFGEAGLGISCDPAMVSGGNYITSTGADVAAMPSNYYHGLPSAERSTANAYYAPGYHHQRGYTLSGPITPPHRRSSSASPPPLTSPRTRQASSSRRSSRHRRAKSTNCTPRQSQSIDKGAFVNFTPHDSNKILSGVAPSGSSKTKARREKEAAEKRRRLSQAAVKAVVEAGGDIESLQAAGLLG